MYETFSVNIRYYAQIYPKEPNLCNVLYNKPVADGVVQPIGGWDKIQAIDISRIGSSPYFGNMKMHEVFLLLLMCLSFLIYFFYFVP